MDKKNITTNNSLPKIYIDGKEIYSAINNIIKNSQKSLYIETFIFHNDKTGRDIVEKLVKKKNEGVDVRIIIDSFGLNFFGENDYEIFDYLRQHNVNVQKYNKYYISTEGINVTHRKIICSDGNKALIGGTNIGDEYKEFWHDLMVELEGEIVEKIQEEFFKDWEVTGTEKPSYIYSYDKEKNFGNCNIELLSTSNNNLYQSTSYKEKILNLINKSQKKIRLTNSYFSSPEIIESIINAKKRGVDICVVVPKDNDNYAHYHLNVNTAKKLIENDIDVYIYNECFSHMKVYIIDNVAILGSANLDNRSLMFNQELSIAITNKKVLEKLYDRVFSIDLKESMKADKNYIDTGIIQDTLINTIKLADYYL